VNPLRGGVVLAIVLKIYHREHREKEKAEGTEVLRADLEWVAVAATLAVAIAPHQLGEEYNAAMNIRLKPETEELIKKDIQNGPYQSVDEYVEHAVSMLHEREAWLAVNRTEIAAKLEEGWRAAERNELSDSDQVIARLEEKKRAWLAEHRRA
jgi:putative addiction module CopG family antidote